MFAITLLGKTVEWHPWTRRQ